VKKHPAELFGNPLDVFERSAAHSGCCWDVSVSEQTEKIFVPVVFLGCDPEDEDELFEFSPGHGVSPCVVGGSSLLVCSTEAGRTQPLSGVARPARWGCSAGEDRQLLGGFRLFLGRLRGLLGFLGCVAGSLGRDVAGSLGRDVAGEFGLGFVVGQASNRLGLVGFSAGDALGFSVVLAVVSGDEPALRGSAAATPAGHGGLLRGSREDHLLRGVSVGELGQQVTDGCFGRVDLHGVSPCVWVVVSSLLVCSTEPSQTQSPSVGGEGGRCASPSLGPDPKPDNQPVLGCTESPDSFVPVVFVGLTR